VAPSVWLYIIRLAFWLGYPPSHLFLIVFQNHVDTLHVCSGSWKKLSIPITSSEGIERPHSELHYRQNCYYENTYWMTSLQEVENAVAWVDGESCAGEQTAVSSFQVIVAVTVTYTYRQRLDPSTYEDSSSLLSSFYSVLHILSKPNDRIRCVLSFLSNTQHVRQRRSRH
jgi:hypothetical protein